MDNSINQIEEKIKELNIDSLIQKNTYIDFCYKDEWFPAFITNSSENSKFDVIISINNTTILQTKKKKSKYSMDFLRSNIYNIDNFERKTIYNEEINNKEYSQIYEMLCEYEKKIINNENEINPYEIVQFFSGIIIDVINKLLKEFKTNISKYELLNINDIKEKVLFFLDFVTQKTHDNIDKLKILYNNQQNRKYMLVDKDYSIIGSYDIFIKSNYKDIINFDDKTHMKYIKNIWKNSYEILVNCLTSQKYFCPIYLYNIILSTFKKNMIKIIEGFETNQILKAYIKNLENLTDQELKNIKQKNYIENINKKFANYMYSKYTEREQLIEKLNYIFYYKCITSQSLEKKIYALNAINDILSLKTNIQSFNYTFFKNLIEEKNILSNILEDGVHDEILKRSIGIFHYLAYHNSIPDNIISQLIEMKKNNLIQNILSDIVSVLPLDKKNKIFNECSKDIDLSLSENIEFITNLTEGCFNLEKMTKKKLNIHINSKYGLELIYDYIVDYINKKSKNDNINFAIDSFIQILSNKDTVKDSIVLEYLNNLILQILNDENNECTVQCIILIKNIFNECFTKRNSKETCVKKLDTKYDLITFFVNNLENYILHIKKIIEKNKIDEDKIYSGIYSYSANIQKRIDIIFFFVRGDMEYLLNLMPEEHLGKMFKILSFYPKNLKILFHYLMQYVDDYPDNQIISYFFRSIVTNKTYIKLEEIKDEEEMDLIIKCLRKLNLENNTFVLDKKNYRVKKAKIDQIDIIFDVLLNNKNLPIQLKCGRELSRYCLNLCEYSPKFSENYWNNYINDIIIKLKKCIEENNLNGINGLIILLDTIYDMMITYSGKIPSKSDTCSAKGETYLFQFHFSVKNHHNYKIKIGKNENLLDVRWRIGYYYDIHVNDVVFENLEGKKYNLLYDYQKFIDLFPPDNYTFGNNVYKQIVVHAENNQLLKLKVNPKKLIENNEQLIKIFLDLIGQNNEEEEKNSRVWKILEKMPKDYYINKIIYKLFNKENIENREIKEIFNLNNIYLLTYNFECIRYYIEINKEKEKELLNIFINVHKGDKILNDLFKKIKISDLRKTYEYKDSQIIFELLSYLLDLLNKIFVIIGNEKQIDNNLVEKLSFIILDIMKISKVSEKEDEKFDKYNITIFKNFISEKLPKLKENEEINLDEKLDKDLFSDQNEFNSYLHFLNEKKFIMHGEILEKILKYLNSLYNNKTGFLEYIINNPKIMNEMLIYEFILSKNIRLQKILYKFLYDTLFEENSKLFFNFIDLIFEKDNFKYISDNDKSGIYLELLSNLICKYIEKNSENIPEYNNKNGLLNVVNSILIYFTKKKEESQLNEEEIEGKANLLRNLIELFPKDILPYILKEDLYKIFLEKFIFSKCNENSVSNPKSCLQSNNSKKSIYRLILSIIRKNPNETINLYLQIIGKLNDFHLLGFWKSNCINNWKIDYSKDLKTKFCGLKNMACTCYMNSILQQFFNIPLLRETILSIKTNENNILYNLQVVFASLKAYESQYYNPKDFALINNLSLYEQMDADEFYAGLIDSIEKDINNIYNNNEETIKNPYKSLFNYFFGGKYVDELKFECGHKRYNEFQYNSIQLDIKGYNNLYDSLNNYIKNETMDGDNKINCEECKTKMACNKRQIFKNLPNILVIVLKRFEFDYDNMIKYKLNDYFEFPMLLDMKNYLMEDSKEKNFKYNLSGIVIHMGTSESGHYYDLIKTSDNKWYEFNDTIVKEFDEKYIPNEAFGLHDLEEENYKDSRVVDVDNANNAYILFYQKIEKNKNREFETKLASPPFNNLSNINNKILKKINIEMYEYWILKNITSKDYQYFILELGKIDVAKYMSDFKVIVNRKFNNTFDKYTTIKREEILDEKYTSNFQLFEEKFPKIILESKDNSDMIFKFLIVYYFNLIYRTKEKSCFYKFTDLIKIYITINIDYAKYIIEEFSDNDTLYEFLISCPNKSLKKASNLIITYSLIKINEEIKGKEEEDNFISLYMNSILSVINLHINEIDIQFIYIILFEILCLDEKYGKELLNIKYDNYINNYYKNNREIEEELLYDEKNFNKLKTNHHILSDKLIKKEYFPKEKLTYSEENFEKKLKKTLTEERNDDFFNYCFLLLINLSKKKK